VPDEPFGKGHERQLRMIFASIAAGHQPYVPGREAREAVDCILAVYEAAREGTTVYRD
jgi:predicted dehydrogenase